MVLCGNAASEQRVVSISGREAPTAQFSPAAEALVLCAAPILQEEGDLQKLVRLVVPASQARPPLGYYALVAVAILLYMQDLCASRSCKYNIAATDFAVLADVRCLPHAASMWLCL